MVLEKNTSPPPTIIEIVTNVQPAQNIATSLRNDSKELEKGNHKYKESSSTQTSSSSGVLHKRKSNSYYASTNGVYRTLMGNQIMMLSRPKRSYVNSPTQRILSAKFLRVKQLQSELTEAQKKITDLQNENKTLKSICKKQDLALRKYESQDSYLPQLLKSHEEEIRVLTLKYKKIRASYNDLEYRYNKQFTELTSVRDRYKHLLQISQDKHLLERERLTKQIEEMRILIQDLNNKIKLQSRRLDLEVKNCKYQLSMEFQKQKSLREQLKQLQDTIDRMRNVLEEKERFIAVCKMNHVVNKTNYLKLNNAQTTNPLKAVRLNHDCTSQLLYEHHVLEHDEKTRNHAITIHVDDDQGNDDTRKNKIFSDVTKNNYKNELLKKAESTNSGLSSQDQSLSLPNVTTTVVIMNEQTEQSSFAASCNGSNVAKKEKPMEIVVKADGNNNNKKFNILVDVNPLKPLKPAAALKKSLSLESFEVCEKTLQDEETNSQRSNDFRRIEDAISWLEVHEKTNYTDIFDTTAESNNGSHTAPFSSDFDDIVERTHTAISEVTESHSHLLREDGLAAHKKTALLRALNAIDLGLKKKQLPLPKAVAVNKLVAKNNIMLKKRMN